MGRGGRAQVSRLKTDGQICADMSWLKHILKIHCDISLYAALHVVALHIQSIRQDQWVAKFRIQHAAETLDYIFLLLSNKFVNNLKHKKKTCQARYRCIFTKEYVQ